MAKAPDPLNLRADSIDGVPDWALKIFNVITKFADQTQQALAGGIKRGENTATSEKLDVSFTTEATPANTFPIKVKHGLQTTPKHVGVGRLSRDDGTTITDVYSMTWRASSGGQVEVTFAGLLASTKYVCNFTFE